MANPKSSDIDNAVIQKLAADAELRTLMPDGVFYGLAPQGAKRYVIVTLIDPTDHSVYGQRAIEDNRYLVKSSGLSTVLTTPQSTAAAHRIDMLLDGQQLTVTGYAWVDCVRDRNETRIRIPRRDEVDAALIWLDGGGFYRVRATLVGA